MASAVKYEVFVEDLANGVHDLFGTDHVLKIMLSNTAPDAAADEVRADAAEISAGGGYTSGGVDVENDGTRSGGTVTIAAVDKTITATAGGIAAFRYAILYNDTPSSPADPLICYWDRGASLALAEGESVDLDFVTSALTIA